LSRPLIQQTGALCGPAFLTYADNYLIELKSAVIVTCAASTSTQEGGTDELAGTPALERSRQGHNRSKMQFAHLKRILKMARLRL